MTKTQTDIQKKTSRIRVASCSVHELFNGTVSLNKDTTKPIINKLTIPVYQRPYVWKEEQLDQLVSDLEAFYANRIKNADLPMYYLGSIILHQNGTELNIIDGQQRITTLAIVQAILDPTQALDIEYSNPTTIQNIQTNYSYLKNKSLKKIDLTQINVTLIITKREDEAYTFFETQNTGGVRLGGVDIIKAYHLRAFEDEKSRSKFALVWEKQKQLKKVVKYLLKARRWSLIDWIPTPKKNDAEGYKKAIIHEFSACSLEGSFMYQNIQFQLNNGVLLSECPTYTTSVRQPFSDGLYFVEYLKCFCEIHERLFINTEDKDIHPEFYSFYTQLTEQAYHDGTSYLKDLFEITVICYVSRFGYKQLLEAAYWIYRCSYLPRVANSRNVTERGIPSYLQKFSLIDYVLQSHNHEQLIRLLDKKFVPTFAPENTKGNTAKTRYINRVGKYFGFIHPVKNKPWELVPISNSIKDNFDHLLTEHIEKKRSQHE